MTKKCESGFIQWCNAYDKQASDPRPLKKLVSPHFEGDQKAKG